MTKQVSITITGTDDELFSLLAFLAGSTSAQVEPPPVSTGKKTPGKKRGPKPKKPKAAPADDLEAMMGDGDETVTLDQVEAAVRDKIKAAKAEGEDAKAAMVKEVRAVFQAHGAEKLSSLEEDDYASALAALEEL